MAHEREILDARRFLSRIQVWPKERHVHVERWVDNFNSDEDREVAHALLDSFVHINEDHRVAALRSTLRTLSSREEFARADDRRVAWGTFIDQAVASIPLSHAGDGAASGYQYLRTARSLGLQRCLDSEHLVGELLKSPQPRPVIFMDDIAGTGRQFVSNWDRSYTTQSGKSSLKKLFSKGRFDLVYFIPIIATERAKNFIESETGVPVLPTYLLGEDYFASSPNSRLVPPALRSRLVDVATRYASLTGEDDEGPLGYKSQGLAVSFKDGAPNNTLPILRPTQPSDDWKPLITND